MADDVTAVVGAGLVKDSWVEGRKSRYVVVSGIPEAEWMKDGMSKLKGGTGEVMWGRRAPVVTFISNNEMCVRCVQTHGR